MKIHLSFLCAIALVLVMQSGCTHLDSGPAVEVSTAERWVILPMQNFSETPQAGERVETLVQSILRNHGVHQPILYPKGDTEDLALLIDDGKRMAVAKKWAKEEGIRFGVTGSIQEWSYKSDLGGEPAVGITLRLVDLQNDDASLWTATASRTGWGSENLTETTTKVLDTMVGQMELKP